jgi:CRISPR-associated protein Csd2
MFEHDRSAARGLMSTRALIVFEHASPLGNAPAHVLFDRVKVVKRTPITRAFADYEVTIDGRAVDAVRTVIPVTEVQAAE